MPAIINYTRIDSQQACGVRNQLRSGVAQQWTDRTLLPYGLRVIPASIRDHCPALDLQERIDLAEKNLKFAEMVGSLMEETGDSENWRPGEYFNVVLATHRHMCYQTAYNVTH